MILSSRFCQPSDSHLITATRFENMQFTRTSPKSILGNLIKTAAGSPPIFFVCQSHPPAPTGEICCFSGCDISSTERRYMIFWLLNQHKFTSHFWVLSEDCLYPPLRLNDASLCACAMKNGSKTLINRIPTRI